MPRNQITAFMAAIFGNESKHTRDPYSARNPSSGAFGKYQIMPSNWGPWSREVFGRVVPQNGPNQEKVTRHKMLQYYDRYGDWSLVAAAWFGGPGAANELKAGNRSVLNRSDGHWTIGKYISEMQKKMRNFTSTSAPVFETPNNRTQSPQPQRPAGYQGAANFDTYGRLFSQIGRTPLNFNPLPAAEDEIAEGDLEREFAGVLEAMARSGTDDGVIEDIDNIAPTITNDDVFDELDSLGTEAFELRQGELSGTNIQSPEFDPEGSAWQITSDPLATPYDHASKSTIQAFNQLGKHRALTQPGDVGVPEDAPADVIPPREVSSPKQLNNPGSRAIDIAKKYLGVPYLWGGTNPKRGLDCSGLVQLVYRQLGVNLPRVSRDQAKAGKRVSSLSNARPGDLVAFASRGLPVGHIGIYIGDNMMIHAPRTGKNVEITSLKGRTPAAIRRVT